MMTTLALVELHRTRWLPPLAVPLVLFWPAVRMCTGLARLLKRDRPTAADKLYAAIDVFRELRGLELDVDLRDHRSIHIRFL